MKKILLLIILLLPTIAAASFVSDNYSTSSYNTGLIGYSDENLTTTTGYQQIGTVAGNENYTLNLGIFENISQKEIPSCGGGICNNGETCLTCPTDCGACPIAPPEEDDDEGGSGGGGGGGISTTKTECTYDWVCSEWYPQNCPKNEIQKKVCVNKGTCDDTLGMPETEQECTFIETEISLREPLFDLFVNIPLRSKLLSVGQNLEAEITLINKGNITPLDVFFTYWVTDKNNKLIIESKDTRAISTGEKFSILQNIPDNLEPGLYKFYTRISYDEDNKIAIAEETFYITPNKTKIIWGIALLISLIILILLTWVTIKFLKRHTKNNLYKKIFKK